MTLDELLKQQSARLEQAMKRRPFEKVDERAADFPEEQRQRRMAELKTRIDDLTRRKADATAAYDRAIALEEAELSAIHAEKPPTPPSPEDPEKPRPSSKTPRSARA